MGLDCNRRKSRTGWIEKRNRKRKSTKWRFKLIANVSLFAVLIKKSPRDARTLISSSLASKNPVSFFMSNKTRNIPRSYLSFPCISHAPGRIKQLQLSHFWIFFIELIIKTGPDAKNFRVSSIEDSPFVEEVCIKLPCKRARHPK